MEDKTLYNESQNDWAFNDDFTRHIHISEAERGLNGYYCLGCKKEMQAIKGTKRIHYYRHHAKNVDKDNTACVVASRKYRELIARDILQRLKEIKVPEIFKYPPMGVYGAPMFLKPSEIISAYNIRSELTFYEDENCNIKFGQNPEIEERFLLIRPDITFFNEKKKPILLVEFVVTHKIDIEKRLKLNRLGLNTVQIIIPKKPEDEIEKALKSITKVKWVYNDIEANTNYVYVSETTDNGVWSIDDEQRNIFEESYKCRSSQIKYLIRTVKRALESESYKRTKHLFESEISKVEKATNTARKKLGVLEKRYDEEAFSEIAGRFEDLDREKIEFEGEEAGFGNTKSNLEEGYIKKRNELEEQFREVKDFESVKKSISKEEADLDQRIREVFQNREGIEEGVLREFEIKNREGSSELSRRIKTLLESQRHASNFADAKRENERYKSAYEFFRKGTWEKG